MWRRKNILPYFKNELFKIKNKLIMFLVIKNIKKISNDNNKIKENLIKKKE